MRNLLKHILTFLVLILIVSCDGAGTVETPPKVFHAKGRVVVIDMEKGTATIDHEEIKGLMSAMTMDFPAKEKKLLEGLENGDLVEFSLSKFGEDIEIVSLRKTGETTISGATLYKESCAKCHGDDGEGKRKGIPLIEGHALSHPEEDFLKQVREGGKKMPSFSDKLSEKEIAAVVDYVRKEIQKGLRKDTGHEH